MTHQPTNFLPHVYNMTHNMTHSYGSLFTSSTHTHMTSPTNWLPLTHDATHPYGSLCTSSTHTHVEPWIHARTCCHSHAICLIHMTHYLYPARTNIHTWICPRSCFRTHMTWLIHMTHTHTCTHDSIHELAAAPIKGIAWHDSCICTPWLIHMTHIRVCMCVCVCVLDVHNMTHSYARYDSFAWLTFLCVCV